MPISLDLPTVLWSMLASAALMLVLIHSLVWWQSRQSAPHLVFAVMAAGVAGIAGFELLLMHQDNPETFGRLIRWGHIPGTMITLALPVYLRLRLGKENNVLFWLAIASRLLVAGLNLSGPQSIAWHAVLSLKRVPFLGSQVWVVDQAVPNPLRWVASLSLVLLGLYVITSWVSHLRRERKMESMVMAAGYAVWMVAGIASTILIHHGVLGFPYLISFSMFPLIGCIAWELSRDTLRAASFARRLEEQAADMELAAGVARIVHWNWDLRENQIWSSGGGRELYGLPGGQRSHFDEFISTVHEDDRDNLLAVLARARESGGFQTEYRLRESGRPGQAEWVLACGKVEFSKDGQPLRIRGVSMDIGERKAAEAEARARRDEVARLSRAGTLGEISGSLAHELNQPLSAILTNAEAAHRLLARQPPATAEAAEFCADVVSSTLRAREVILKLRALLENGESDRCPVSLDDLVAAVLDLLHTELKERAITVDFRPGDVPMIDGDRVQLQQLFLNLFLNAAEAMQNVPAAGRLLVIESHHDDVQASIIFLTGRGTIPMGVEAMKHGAADFLTKPVEADILLPAVRAALESSAARARDQAIRDNLRIRHQSLTEREKEVMARVVAGHPNKVIASEFGTSEQNVKIHRGRAMTKMGALSVAELVRMATTLGNIGAEPSELR